MDLSKEFSKLFISNPNSFGSWQPSTGKMFTTKQDYTITNVEDHLNGKMGIGLVAILPKGKCHWGAIDIDNHSGVDINLPNIVQKVHELGLPLVVCQSKSKGAHCYLFGSEPLPSHFVRVLLAKWATELGFTGAEVFPKQSKLKGSQLGNWINMPYFAGNQRQAFVHRDGKCLPIPLEEFVITAKTNQVTQASLEGFILAEHKEAPPCIQQMMKNGVDSGHRNEGLYNLTVYFRKAYPDDYKERVFDINQTIFDKPLSFVEAKKTVASAGNKEYRYKCLEEPCRQYCNSDDCLLREHGISSDEAEVFSLVDMPNITDVKIIDMEPPMWEMKLNGEMVHVSTSQFVNMNEFTKVIMEKLLIMVPPMKSKDWRNVLAGLMANVERVKTPEQASAPGIIKVKLMEFIDKADLSSGGKDVEDRILVLRGIPVVQELGTGGMNGRHVIFRGNDFITHLKRTRSDELSGAMLWNALRHFGVTHSRIRIGGRVTAIWAVPLDKYDRSKLEYDYNDPEAPPEWVDSEGMKFKSEF